MKGRGQGYLKAVIPDDTAGPLTPGERAAIADLERRLLLTTPVPGHGRPRPERLRAVVGHQSSAPVVALLVAAVALVALALAVGGGLLGVAAVVASAAGSAVLWPLLPPRFGGPVRPPLGALRHRRRVPRRR